MNHHPHLFRCFIIGEGSLPIQCAERLQQHGHNILGIISADAELCRWAQDNDVPLHAPDTDLVALMQQQPCEYLFSVNNGYIIPHEALALPTQYAINYHDSPLPKYAGMYATSWAILHGETQHGITWHVMTTEIDAGDILKQVTVDVTPTETAFTLNTKCYEAALTAFAELVHDLESDSVTPILQDPTQRTYFSLYQRPPGGSVISWQQPAEEIYALYRALDFGPYPNALSLPKIMIGTDLYLIADLALGHDEATTTPGTILAIDEDAAAPTWTIATASRALILKQLQTIDGIPVALTDLAAQNNLRVGQRLLDLSPTLVQSFSDQTKHTARHEGFWRQRLATLQPIDLPYRQAFDPPAQTADDEDALPVPIPDAVAELLEAHGWHTPHFLLTLFAVYLARLHDAGSFDIGLAVESAPCANFFASQVPLRIELDGSGSFAEAYQTLNAEYSTCARRQTYARDMVPRDPDLRATPTLGAGLPVSVAITPETREEYQQQDGVTLHLLTDALSTDLDANPSFTDNHVVATIRYNPARFDPTLIGNIVGHLQTLMMAIVATPEQPIQTLPLLTDTERHQQFVEWNDTSLDIGEPQPIHTLFEAQVAQTPDAVAVMSDASEQVASSVSYDYLQTCNVQTYCDLNARANQVAHQLRAQGIGPNKYVGLYAQRSSDMIAGLLGILKAGGVYVPLDPAYPTERLNFMIAEAGIDVLLVDAADELPDDLTSNQCQIVAFNDHDVATQSTTNPYVQVGPDDLAYLIFTSGSTGQPKGVKVTHRPLATHCEIARDTFGLTPQDRVLQFASMSFDVALEQIFPPLIAGAAVVIGDLWLPNDFHQHLTKYSLTVADLPLSYLQQLFAHWAAAPTLISEHDLRLLIVGNEAIPREFVARWQNSPLRTARLLNAYGPTEAVISTSFYEVTPELELSQSVRHLPIANAAATRVQAHRPLYVLDANMQPVPVGVPGELYIGNLLADGYLNQPAQTAKAFVKNPFAKNSSNDGEILYKTGDLVRYWTDGTLEFLGRIDHQVKIRGFRIELGEIEAALLAQEGVSEAAVTTRETAQGDQQIVAYVVGKSEIDALRHALSQLLPDYMVPAAFVALESMPLTPNGKVDRKALPAPEDVDSQQTYVAPQSALEEKLSSIWQEVLAMNQVGIHDNFFEIGGHSLLATQVISRAKNVFQLELTLQTLFANPTIAQFAQYIEQTQLALAFQSLSSSIPSSDQIESAQGKELEEAQEILVL